MDATITVALINLAGGGLGMLIVQGVWKWLRGHYSSVQEAEDKAEEARNALADLRNEYDYLRAWILAQPLTEDQLARIPKAPERARNKEKQD